MKKNGIVGIAIICLTLAGCYQPTKPSLSVKPHGAYARVRITYADERSKIAVFGDSNCNGSRTGEHVSALVSPHMTTKEAMTLLKPASTSLGMPKTAKTPRVYYEYYIEGDKPALIQVTYDASSINPSAYTVRNPICSSTAIFVPAAGKDYEVGPTGTCRVMVKELGSSHGKRDGYVSAVDAPVLICGQVLNQSLN